jgi:hypothetical protein
LCPFCFAHFSRNDVKFRCANARCTQEKDEGLEEYQGITTPMNIVFPHGERALPREAECPKCSKPTTNYVCPKCHFDLLPEIGKTDERIVAVIGGRSTGKSNYIATLVRQLKTEISTTFDTGTIARGDMTNDRYNKYFQPLFTDKKVLPPTPPGDPQTKIPMVYRVKFNKHRNRAATLVFFDTAGEDMRSLDAMSKEAKYITMSHGLIFLLDPLQIPAVRALLPPDVLRGAGSGTTPDDIVANLVGLFEKDPTWRRSPKIKTPVAFTLSKIDALLNVDGIIDPGSPLRRAGGHAGYLNNADVEAINAEIESHLYRWMNDGAFKQLIGSHFEDYCFFGMSALGRSPNADGTLDSIEPLRVADPMLWLFKKYGFIRGK